MDGICKIPTLSFFFSVAAYIVIDCLYSLPINKISIASSTQLEFSPLPPPVHRLVGIRNLRDQIFTVSKISSMAATTSQASLLLAKQLRGDIERDRTSYRFIFLRFFWILGIFYFFYFIYDVCMVRNWILVVFVFCFLPSCLIRSDEEPCGWVFGRACGWQ